jgi:hypothetical protein
MQGFDQFELRKLGVMMEKFIYSGRIDLRTGAGSSGLSRGRIGIDTQKQFHQTFFHSAIGMIKGNSLRWSIQRSHCEISTDF